MDDVPVLDEGALARLDEWGGAKLRDQMVRLYLENARARLDQIDVGLENPDGMRAVELAAHSLKSSAANVGLMRVSAVSDRLETAANTGDASTARGLRSELHAAVHEGEAALTGLGADGEG